MRIKCIKNGLKTSRYVCSQKWGIPLALGHSMGHPNLSDRKSCFLFWSQGLRGHPMGHPNYMRCPRWIVPQRAMIQNAACRLPIEGDDPGGSFHHVLTQVFMYLRFETYQNSSKYSQMNSNQFGHSQKAFKTSPTC